MVQEKLKDQTDVKVRRSKKIGGYTVSTNYKFVKIIKDSQTQ